MKFITAFALFGLVGMTMPSFADNVREAKCRDNQRACINEARNSCGGDIRVLSSESHSGGLLADRLPGPVRWYSILYECSRHYRPAEPDYSAAPPRRPTYDAPPAYGFRPRGLAAQCSRIAAQTFGQPLRNIMSSPSEPSRYGYVVYGQFPPRSANVKTFVCTFDRDGTFIGLKRT